MSALYSTQGAGKCQGKESGAGSAGRQAGDLGVGKGAYLNKATGGDFMRKVTAEPCLLTCVSHPDTWAIGGNVTHPSFGIREP